MQHYTLEPYKLHFYGNILRQQLILDAPTETARFVFPAFDLLVKA